MSVEFLGDYIIMYIYGNIVSYYDQIIFMEYN